MLSPVASRSVGGISQCGLLLTGVRESRMFLAWKHDGNIFKPWMGVGY